MTKKGFTKLLLIVAGIMSFVFGMILACDYSGMIHWIGVVALVVGVLSLFIGIITPKSGINKQKLSRVLGVLLVSAILHGLGIVLMIYVHWLAGLPLVLIGILSLLFLIPAVKGFKE